MEVQCKTCKSPVLLSRCLTCAKCKSYYHHECVQMNDSTPSLTWECDACTLPSPIILELHRLQNEITLERQAIDKRFDILQKHINIIKTEIEKLSQRVRPTTHNRITSNTSNTDTSVDDEISNNESSTNLESGLQKKFARQVIPSDLPIFTGNPEDWPIFISCYRNSTVACGFTAVENLIRLQRCLRGPARQAVCSKLLLPECVEQVIETLQLLYRA